MATTTTEKIFDCVLVGDRHHGLTEGVRGLLETMFKTVVMVADVPSLQTSAGRLQPELAVVDISLKRDGSLEWLQRLRQRCPERKVIVLSFHDEPSARRAAMESGADDFVLTRALRVLQRFARAGNADGDLRERGAVKRARHARATIEPPRVEEGLVDFNGPLCCQGYLTRCRLGT